MAKELLNIKIQTLPNGYALTVGSNEYMYFTVGQLLEGMLYHVGLGETEYAGTEDIREILDAAVAYRADNGNIVKNMVRLTQENERLEALTKKQKKIIEKQKKLIK
jgi:hypothetical protein